LTVKGIAEIVNEPTKKQLFPVREFTAGLLGRGIFQESSRLFQQTNKEKEYWLEKLAGISEMTAFPYDYNRKHGNTTT